jgi:SAM-dependent methyltransferase
MQKLGWTSLPLSDDLSATSFDAISQDDCARAATFGEIEGLLVSPDTQEMLVVMAEGLATSSRSETFPMRGQRPMLLPKYARDCVSGDSFNLPADAVATSGQQYLLLSSIKMRGGPQNSDYNDIWFHRHVYRSRRLLQTARGLVLDVGCDKPSISRKLFPSQSTFLGLEPSLGASGEFCICGMGEHLPLKSESLDGVAFITSLDHVLDYHQALDEAYRVLKPGGMLYLASLVWTERASLIGDTVHFHHFRDFELIGALRRMSIETLERYVWKNDQHRYGVYLAARKPV